MAHHNIRSEDGLLPWQQHFAAGIAKGLTVVAAYCKAKGYNTKPRANVQAKALQASSDPGIANAVRSFLREAKIGDLFSIGEFHANCARILAKAEEDKNYTACAALLRLQGQTIDALTEKRVLRVEQAASDADLVNALSGGDPAKAEALRGILGQPDEYVQ